MAYASIPGEGVWLGLPFANLAGGIIGNGGFTSNLIDATGEKFAFIGRVGGSYFSGTKAIRRVAFRFGTVTKAGGSALTLSLQNWNDATGPPGQPDETQDETVAIANADAAFASNTWYRTGTLSADRTVTYGDPIAVVIEYDGAGRLSTDAVNITSIGLAVTGSLANGVLKTASWASSGWPNVVLEFSDGSFASLGGIPVKTLNSHVFNSGSAADEFALPISLAYPCKVNAIGGAITVAGGTSNFDVVLYQGTTALVTVSIDANHFNSTSASRFFEVPIVETELVASTQYYVAFKPTSANSITMYSFDVDDANHLSVYPGGTSLTYSTRVDAGAWAAATTTRRLIAGVRISAVSDGAGGSAGGHVIGGGVG